MARRRSAPAGFLWCARLRSRHEQSANCERLRHRAPFYLNRFFGLAFAGRFPVEISVRTASASLASLNSRRRAMFSRMAIVFLAASSKTAARSPTARRCLFVLASCSDEGGGGADQGSDRFIIWLSSSLLPQYVLAQRLVRRSCRWGRPEAR